MVERSKRRAPEPAAPSAPSAERWPSWTGLVSDAGLPGPVRPVDRIAFAIHLSELTNHYAAIWEGLPPGTFELVYSSDDPESNRRTARFAEVHGYPASYVGDVLAEGRSFKAVVSNHMGAAGRIGTEYGVTRLGRLQARLMYSLGKDGWNFQQWNKQYDVILCYGPYQASRLAEFERPRVVQVGYPRFDRFFSIAESRRDIVARLGGDPDRPTLVWLPTWANECSIPAFADTIASLRDEMNVLVKVHPLTATQGPYHMGCLEEAGLRSVADVDFDNVELFYAADIVAADYGGSPFGAIYTDRDLVLLNTPAVDYRGHELSPSGSLDTRLREWILNIDPGEGQLIRDYLRDPAAREQQRGVRGRLRRSVFAPFDGCSAKAAALVLSNLDSICSR
jgi:hypothetical protein